MGCVKSDFGKRGDRGDAHVRPDEPRRVWSGAPRASRAVIGNTVAHGHAGPSVTMALRHSNLPIDWTDSLSVLVSAVPPCSKRQLYPITLSALTGTASFGASTILGSRIVKVDPRPSSLSTVMSPPIIWQKRWLMTRTRPVPPYLLAVVEDACENSRNNLPSCAEWRRNIKREPPSLSLVS
jgi:hypothetical protein